MRTFITIAIALCLTAPLLAAENTCVSPCIVCESPAADMFQCVTCWGQELKAAVAPATLKACGAATLATNCQIPDSADVTKCASCKSGFSYYATDKVCTLANADIPKCMTWFTTDGTTSICSACTGDFAPNVTTGSEGTDCSVAASGVTECAGYSTATACAKCNAEFILDTGNTCTAVTDANRGCASLTGAVCNGCDASSGYYATSFTTAAGSTCTKNSTIMMIKIAFALVIASLF